MRNGTTPQSGNGCRDKNGLNAKQRQSLPVIATAKSRRQGVIECGKQKIVSVAHWYRVWWKQPAYVKAVNQAEEELHGEVKDRIHQLAIAEGLETMRNIIRVAHSAGTNNMRAAEMHLGAIGVDTGRSSRFTKSTTHIEQNIYVQLRQELAQKPPDELERILKDEVAGLNRLKETHASGPNKN